MSKWCAYLRGYSIIAVALLISSGCVSLPGPGTRLDVDSLRNAIVSDHADYVRAAVDARLVTVNERIPAPIYAEGTPLITIAARAGSVEVTRYLISAGADLNARTPAYETALMLAAYFPADEGAGAAGDGRHEKVARMLVEAGATLENEPHNYTALAYAAYQGRDHIIRFLIQRGARINADASYGKVYVNTPLMMAAMQGKVSSTLLLLRSGADAKIRVSNGHTAAELAAKYQGGNLVALLKCAESAGSGETFARRCEGAR